MNKTTAAGLARTHTRFSKAPLHIPNSKGEPFKTELVEVHSDELTIKWNFWHLPDDLRDPHNHPWRSVTCTILNGGYTEERYFLDHGEVKKVTNVHRVGDVNSFGPKAFHIVTEVLPDTVTRMVCGHVMEGYEWGYLDIKTGKYTVAEKDPDFMKRLKDNNRFLK